MERITSYLPSKKEIVSFLALAMCLFLCVSLFMTINLNVAYCADTNTNTNTNTTTNTNAMAQSISDVITLGATKIYSIFRAIVIPIVIAIIGYSGLLLLGGSAQSMTKAKTVLIYCFIGTVLIVFAPLIGKEVAGWLNDSSTYSGDLGDYNPLK